jgi:hypothetical protein
MKDRYEFMEDIYLENRYKKDFKGMHIFDMVIETNSEVQRYEMYFWSERHLLHFIDLMNAKSTKDPKSL